MASGRLLQFFSRPSTAAQKNHFKKPSVIQWQDTGKVFYLLDTLKLSYEGEFGLVTLEQVNINQLEGLLASISKPRSQYFRRRTTAGQDAAVHLSVCGVTWQEHKNQLRIKAIADAAVFRAKDHLLRDTQAIFQHAELAADDTAAVTHSPLTTAGVLTASSLSHQQFIARLKAANAQLSNRYRQKITINRHHFKQLFSPHEQQFFQQQLGINIG